MADFLRRRFAWPRLTARSWPAGRIPLRGSLTAACTRDMPLPAHRSPYRSDDPIDGASTVAVRPYVGAC